MLNTVNARVLTGYASVLLVTLLAAAVLTLNNREVARHVNMFVSETLPALKHIDNIKANTESMVLIGYSLYGYTLEANEFDEQFDRIKESTLAAFYSLGYTDDDDLLQDCEALSFALNALFETMTADSVNWDVARSDLQRITQLASQFQQGLDEVRVSVAKAANSRTAEIEAQLFSSQIVVYSLIVILSTVVLIAFWLTKRSIAQPIACMADELDELAKTRNLVTVLPAHSTQELNRMTDSLQGLVNVFDAGLKDVREAATGIDNATLVLTQSSSASTTSVANLRLEIDALVVIMDALHEGMSQSLTRSEVAAQVAQQSAGDVRLGRENVQQTATAISDLTADIEQTADILVTLQNEGENVSSVVKTIADIAAQTNLLALNAAIEAARAGESGRGFAVVADEVRTLAARTHQSTLEINDILEKIVTAIQRAGTTMSSNQDKARFSVSLANELVDSLTEGEATISSLVAVSQEAATLASQSQQQVENVKAVVDKFNGLGSDISGNNEQVEKASGTLIQLASNLNILTNKFKLS